MSQFRNSLSFLYPLKNRTFHLKITLSDNVLEEFSFFSFWRRLLINIRSFVADSLEKNESISDNNKKILKNRNFFAVDLKENFSRRKKYYP